MDTITGTWKGGQIVLNDSVDWPEGTPVVITAAPGSGVVGTPEDDRPYTPQQIDSILKLVDRFEPVEWTSEELAAWQAVRKVQREYDAGKSVGRNRRIEELFP
jgi:hypothetical protein